MSGARSTEYGVLSVEYGALNTEQWTLSTELYDFTSRRKSCYVPWAHNRILRPETTESLLLD